MSVINPSDERNDEDLAAVESNRRLWEAWADLHVGSDFYDVEGFLADPNSRPLDPIVLDLVGEVAGARLLHLQCHFGLDTIRFALWARSRPASTSPRPPFAPPANSPTAPGYPRRSFSRTFARSGGRRGGVFRRRLHLVRHGHMAA